MTQPNDSAFSAHERPAGAARPLVDDTLAAATLLMPCDAADAYNLERSSRSRYCLTVAAPGFGEDEIEVEAKGGCLHIVGTARLDGTAGAMLHRGLDGRLDRTFLMIRPFELTGWELRRGLLRIYLRESPGAGVEAVPPLRLEGVEAVALAA